MRIFGTWNVRSLYKARYLTATARKLGRYKLDLVSVQWIRWDKGGTVREGNYNFFYGKKIKSSIGNRIFVQRRILSAVTRVEFVSDRMSYIVLRGR